MRSLCMCRVVLVNLYNEEKQNFFFVSEAVSNWINSLDTDSVKSWNRKIAEDILKECSSFMSQSVAKSLQCTDSNFVHDIYKHFYNYARKFEDIKEMCDYVDRGQFVIVEEFHGDISE